MERLISSTVVCWFAKHSIFVTPCILQVLKTSLTLDILRHCLILVPWRLSKIWRTEKPSTFFKNHSGLLSVLKENKIWNSPNWEKKISQYWFQFSRNWVDIFLMECAPQVSVQLEKDLEWCLDVTKANYMKLREGPQVIEANPWRQSKASKWWPWRRMFRHLRFQPIKIELVRLWSCKVYKFFVHIYIVHYVWKHLNSFYSKSDKLQFQRWVGKPRLYSLA